MNDKLKILLVVSLGLNLFAVGGVTGALIMGAWVGFKRGPAVIVNGGPGPSMRGSSVLGPEEGRALRSRLRQAAEAGDADRQAARQARQDAVRLIAQQRYDAQAVAAAFARSRAGELAARARIEAALADGLQTVDAGKRAQFAEQMMRSPRGRRGGRPEGPPPPPPLPPRP